MKRLSGLKKGIAEVKRLYKTEDFEKALHNTEELLEAWPGNSQLLVTWADLVQLQQETPHSLADVKKAYQEASDIDDLAESATLELAHFMDTVEDKPKVAAKQFAKAVAAARQLLSKALLGQAKCLLQMNKKDQALACIAEAIQLGHANSGEKSKANGTKPFFVVYDSQKPISTMHLDGQFADEVQRLLEEVHS